jgi:glycosyltransferase involved in cell wall biosynthesis
MKRPISVLELRSVRGTGGGPEKTIILGAALTDRSRISVTVCYVRDVRDEVFGVDLRAAAAGVDYIEVAERNSFDLRSLRALRRVVRERQIDIVHAHDYKTNLLAWLLSRRERVIPLSTAHGWTSHTFRCMKIYYPLDKRLMKLFPRVLAVSSEIRGALLGVGVDPSRVTVILNAIDPFKFRRDRTQEAAARRALNLPEGSILIGAVGRLEPQKRFDLLIEAFHELHERWPTLRLVIAGEGSARGELEGIIERLKLQGRCVLLGHQNDVSLVHHALDMFVQTSTYEGTSNAVLEAMAFETPIVATAAGGTAEQIDDRVHGRIVPIDNRAVLVEAIEWTLSHSTEVAAQVSAARRRIENELSFHRRVETVNRVYEELVGCKTGNRAESS